MSNDHPSSSNPSLSHPLSSSLAGGLQPDPKGEPGGIHGDTPDQTDLPHMDTAASIPAASMPRVIKQIIEKTGALNWHGAVDVEQRRLQWLGCLLGAHGLAKVVRKLAYFKEEDRSEFSAKVIDIYALKIGDHVFGLNGGCGWDAVADFYCKEQLGVSETAMMVWPSREVVAYPLKSGMPGRWVDIVKTELVLEEKRVITHSVEHVQPYKSSMTRKI